MAYLEPAEYAAYGLSADTADAWVYAASAMIDAHCKRSTLSSASYTETLRVRRHTGTVQLTYGPVAAVTALQLQYALRHRMTGGMLGECAFAFGLPGQWVDADATAMTVYPGGEAALPTNLFGVGYSDARVTYTAGYAVLPEAVKVACAQVVKNAQATPGMNVRASQLDTIRTEYFSDSLLDSQVKALLRPFVAERMS